MSLLADVIIAHRCRSTHHFIAMDALSLIQGPDAARWRNLLLSRHENLLNGAKAPDTDFKDFKNHVLHVSDNNWGGAPRAAKVWYNHAVDALSAKRWSDAAYALGVMSHYYTDPIQPFHTGQTEEEGAMHRALEWSIAKSRGVLKGMIEEKGYPRVAVPSGADFLEDMICHGARYAHPHYETFLDHYDLDVGVKDPANGLDDTLRDVISDLIAYATAGLAGIFERAFEVAAVTPPKVDVTLRGYLSTVDIPIRWITKKLDNLADKKTVEAMYKEYKLTGKVVKALPDDDKAVRAMHAREVLNVGLQELDVQPIKKIGTRHGSALADEWGNITAAPETVAESPRKSKTPDVTKVDIKPTVATNPATPTTETKINSAPESKPVIKPVANVVSNQMTLLSDVVEAPSIGPKTAERLNNIDIYTIGDFLAADPAEMSKKVNVRYMSAAAMTDWQAQTRLMLDVPGLRVHDAQILVGTGVCSGDDLLKASARDVFAAATNFIDSSAGKRVIRNKSDHPDLEEVDHWIDLAKASSGN